jgi:hypothetical protein
LGSSNENNIDNQNVNDMGYTFFFTGPLIFKTKVSLEDIEKIKKLCSKDVKKDFSNQLAGHIEHEYVIDVNKMQLILHKYLEKHKEAYKIFYNTSMNYPGKLMKIKNAWVNFMKNGEENPIHVHTKCNFSSVIFLNIPKGLKEEIKKYKGTSIGPGHLSFQVHSVSDYYIDNIYVQPEIGDFYIFPWNVKHNVTTFKSKGERVSAACNFVFENDDNK